MSAQCKLRVYLGVLLAIMATIKRPPGKNKKPLGCIGNHTMTWEDRSCACNYAFLGFYGLFEWVHLGMVHRCLTTICCRCANAVRARCNNTLLGMLYSH